MRVYRTQRHRAIANEGTEPMREQTTTRRSALGATIAAITAGIAAPALATSRAGNPDAELLRLSSAGVVILGSACRDAMGAEENQGDAA